MRSWQRWKHWHRILTGSFCLLLLIIAGSWYWHSRPVELRIGLFAGSNWDVPEGDSYAVIEAAIQQFEAQHPGVCVTYSSGIKKEDYSEWLAEQLLGGTEPDVFVIPEADFNL